MTLKHLGTFHCYFTLCASFHSHQWIKAGVTVWKRPIRVKISDFCPMWPWKLMDDLEKQQGTSSMQRQALIMHHFVATDEFELELLSGNVQFWGKFAGFSRITFKFDRWLKKTKGHLFYASSSCVHHFVAIDEFKLGIHSIRVKIEDWLWPLTSDLWPLAFCMDFTSVNGYNFWKCRDDMMRGTY